MTPRTTERLAAHGLRLHSCQRHRAKAESAARFAARTAAIDARGRTRRCLHKRANHQHGAYVTYVADGCRCRDCADAAVAYERNRIRQTAYGRWHPFTDADPVRAHVRSLMARGMGLKRIMAAASMSGGTMVKLLYGVEGRPPSQRVRQATADRLLAVELDLADGVRVPAEPTWRLIHGLIALGYTKTWIAHQIGQRGPGLQLRRTFISKGHADAIRGLADSYGATPGPSERSRRFAATQGWTPDLLWDDIEASDAADELIDPVVVDRLVAAEPVARPTKHERFEAYRRLIDMRMPHAEIARRLHLSGVTQAQYAARLTHAADALEEATA